MSILKDYNKLDARCKSFIGTQFKTGKQSVLTVVGVHKDTNQYVLTCSKCSLFIEVFPLGSIQSAKTPLNNGHIPCYCSSHPKCTTEQNITMLNSSILKDTPYNIVEEGIRTKAGHRKYIITCDICSKDEELFPEGSLQATANNLRSGSTPCGCSKSYKWSEKQNKIRVERMCREKGYIFNGWVDGMYNGGKTFLNLFNPSTGNLWSSSILSSFLSLGTGDPSIPHSGYNPSKPGWFYLYRWTLGLLVVYKYGVTNKDSTRIRINKQKRFTKYTPELVLEHYYSDGNIPLEVEKLCEDLTKGYHNVNKEYFKDGYTETFITSNDNFYNIKSKIKHYMLKAR